MKTKCTVGKRGRGGSSVARLPLWHRTHAIAAIYNKIVEAKEATQEKNEEVYYTLKKKTQQEQ